MLITVSVIRLALRPARPISVHCLRASLLEKDNKILRHIGYHQSNEWSFCANETLTPINRLVPHLGNIVGSVLSADVFSRYTYFGKIKRSY